MWLFSISQIWGVSNDSDNSLSSGSFTSDPCAQTYMFPRFPRDMNSLLLYAVCSLVKSWKCIRTLRENVFSTIARSSIHEQSRFSNFYLRTVCINKPELPTGVGVPCGNDDIDVVGRDVILCDGYFRWDWASVSLAFCSDGEDSGIHRDYADSHPGVR